MTGMPTGSGGPEAAGHEAAAAAAGTASDVLIRQAIGDDLDAVVDVGRRTWPATYASMFEDGLVSLFLEKKWTKQALVPCIRSGRTLVAEVAGRIVGMASYGPHDTALALWRLYVLPEAQGRGIGARLLGEVMSHAEAVGRELHIPFTDGNTSAYRFSCSHGFTRMRRESQGEMPDLIWMSRPDVEGAGCVASGAHADTDTGLEQHVEQHIEQHIEQRIEQHVVQHVEQDVEQDVERR